jgi:Skp family chaperone for outer membrane proteins
LPKALVVALAVLAVSSYAHAQSSPGYFMPPSAPTAPAPVQHAAPQPQPQPQAVPSDSGAANAAAPSDQQQAQQSLPPIPQLPSLPKEPPPPAPVIGVLSVPEVMQKSTAAQGVQQIIHDRQAALGNEAQQARATIEAKQAQIVAQRSKLTDAQLEAKEKTLEDQVAATQKDFEQRNQAIQNSGQAALGVIESELIAVIRQVAEAHGMNLVLHREQVALNVNAFDITDEVASQLNKLLPSVPVPPSVVTPGMAITPPSDDDGEESVGP